MNHGIKSFVIPVKDVAAAKALYTTLFGAEPYVENQYYVGYKVGDQDIGLDPNGHKMGMTGSVAYCDVDDIKASLKAVIAAGATVLQDLKDIGNGKLIAIVKDADGNVIGLRQT